MLVRIAACVVVLGSFAAVGCESKPTVATHQPTPEEQEALRVINQLRSTMKLPPLPQDTALSFIARAHAQEVAATGGKEKPPPEWLDREALTVGQYGNVQLVSLDMEKLRVKNAVEEFFTPINRHKYMKPEVKVCGIGFAQHEGRGKFYLTILFSNQASK